MLFVIFNQRLPLYILGMPITRKRRINACIKISEEISVQIWYEAPSMYGMFINSQPKERKK